MHVVSKVSCKEKNSVVLEKRSLVPFAKINLIIIKCAVRHKTLSHSLAF